MNSLTAEVRVRRMGAADLDRVMGIAGSLEEAPQWAASAYAAAIDSEHIPRRIALVAADLARDTIAGFLIAGTVSPGAELETIAVAAEAQRSGVGGLLLRALVKELRAERVTELTLEVRASNGAALAFYQAQGFKENGRRRCYYADPEEDAVLMRLSVV